MYLRVINPNYFSVKLTHVDAQVSFDVPLGRSCADIGVAFLSYQQHPHW